MLSIITGHKGDMWFVGKHVPTAGNKPFQITKVFYSEKKASDYIELVEAASLRSQKKFNLRG